MGIANDAGRSASTIKKRKNSASPRPRQSAAVTVGITVSVDSVLVAAMRRLNRGDYRALAESVTSCFRNIHRIKCDQPH
jgi:hypothetical protein